MSLAYASANDLPPDLAVLQSQYLEVQSSICDVERQIEDLSDLTDPSVIKLAIEAAEEDYETFSEEAREDAEAGYLDEKDLDRKLNELARQRDVSIAEVRAQSERTSLEIQKLEALHDALVARQNEIERQFEALSESQYDAAALDSLVNILDEFEAAQRR